MPEQDAATRHRAAPGLWTGLLVVMLLLVGLLLAGGQLVQVGVPLEAMPAQAAEPDAGLLVTRTVYFPIVYRDYPCRPVQSVSISTDSLGGTIGVPHTFTAWVTPATASLPITYTWQATGQSPIVHHGGWNDSASFTWDAIRTQDVTVEAYNRCRDPISDTLSVVSDTLTVDITTRGLIAFERHATADDPHDIWLMYNDGTRQENLTNSPGADEGAPTWSPDGYFVAFGSVPLSPPNSNSVIYKIDLRTGAKTQLTNGVHDDYWPAWSPNGDKIAFMRRVDGASPDIWVMNANGTNKVQLTDWPLGDEFPAWSPDGAWIAFSSTRDWAGRDLYVMRANGTDQQRLLLTENQDELYPTWRPNGWIYYTWQISKSPRKDFLYRMDPATIVPKKVFGDQYNRYIASWSPDGQCFSFYSTMGEVAGTDKEVWKWCRGFTSPINLTDNNEGDEFSAWSPVP